MPKKNQTHLIKIELMRYCLLWGYSEELTVSYFKSKGYNLSHAHYYNLKAEVLSDETVQDWYSDVSLRMMEREHKWDFDQIVELEKITMTEIGQLTLTNVYIQDPEDVKKAEKDPKHKIKFLLNPEHDSAMIAKLISTLAELKKVKSDMLSATPVVQAIMIKKRKDEEKKKLLEEKALATNKSKV